MTGRVGPGADEKVVFIAGRRGDVTHPALAQVRGYWEALRRRGALPRRADIDPQGIERALEFAFVAERIAPGHARLRLAGNHLCDLMGMDLRGMPLSTLFEPAARPALAALVERAFTGEEPAELQLASGRGLGRPPLAARMLLLPLRTESGAVARVLGALAAEGRIGRAPRRFDFDGPIVTSASPVTGSLEVSGLGEAPAPWRSRGARSTRAHLWLVHSAD